MAAVLKDVVLDVILLSITAVLVVLPTDIDDPLAGLFDEDVVLDMIMLTATVVLVVVPPDMDEPLVRLPDEETGVTAELNAAVLDINDGVVGVEEELVNVGKLELELFSGTGVNVSVTSIVVEPICVVWTTVYW